MAGDRWMNCPRHHLPKPSNGQVDDNAARHEGYALDDDHDENGTLTSSIWPSRLYQDWVQFKNCRSRNWSAGGIMDNPKYSDLHAHIAALDKAGLLIRVKRLINKDTEMHPLVRWQFRGSIPEASARRFCSRTSSTARAAVTTCRSRSACSPPIGTSTALASAARSTTSRKTGIRREQNHDRAGDGRESRRARRS